MDEMRVRKRLWSWEGDGVSRFLSTVIAKR
jgi:hypothetical protein